MFRLGPLLLVILFAASLAAAKDEVVLTGNVTSVYPVYVSENKYNCGIGVGLQFRNDTNEPIIIPRPGTADSRLVFIKDYLRFRRLRNTQCSRQNPTNDTGEMR